MPSRTSASYPHISGSTAPKKPDDWMAESQTNPMVTADERSQHTEATVASHLASEELEPLLQWDSEEELLVSPVSGGESSGVSLGKQITRVVLFVGILASAAQTFRIAMSPAGRQKTTLSTPPLGPEKFSV